MPPSTPPSPPQTSSAASSSTPTPSQSSPFYHKYNSLVQKIVKMSPKGKIVDPRQAAKNDVLGSIGKDTATAHGNSSGEEDLRLRRDLASSTTNHDQARFQQTERAVELSQQDKTPTMEYQNNDRLRHLLRRNVWRDDESAMRGVASVQRGNASSFPQQQGANGLGGGRPLIFAGTPPSPHHFRPSNESSSPSTSTHRPGLTSPSDKVPLLLSSMTPVHILEALLGEFESDDENFNSEDDNMDLTPPPETESLAAQPSRRSSFSSSFSSINNASPAANRRSKSPSTTRRRRSSSAKRRRKVTSKTGKPKSRAYYMTKHLTSSLNMHAFFKFVLSQQKSYFDAMELLRESDERLEDVLKKHHDNKREQIKMEQQVIRLRHVVRSMKDEERRKQSMDREEKEKLEVQVQALRKEIELMRKERDGETRKRPATSIVGQSATTSTTASTPAQNTTSTTPSKTIACDEVVITDPSLKQVFLDQRRTIKRLTKQLDASNEIILVYKTLEQEVLSREKDVENYEYRDKDQAVRIRNLEHQLETTILIIQEQENRIEAAESLLNRISQEDCDVVMRAMESAQQGNCGEGQPTTQDLSQDLPLH